MKERIEYLDLLKGIAILLVVIGHFVQFNTALSQQNFVWKLIYSFHMELFMFLSGYLAVKTIVVNDFKGAVKFVNKRAVALLIPFFTGLNTLVKAMDFSPRL